MLSISYEALLLALDFFLLFFRLINLIIRQRQNSEANNNEMNLAALRPNLKHKVVEFQSYVIKCDQLDF